MRKIEAQMVMAVRDQLSGSEKTFRSGNTEVSTEHRGIHGTPSYYRNVVVRLHGNEIARFDGGIALKITDAGWQTNTTKSRLNALLSCFYGGQRLSQIKGQWRLNANDFNGTAWIAFRWQNNACCWEAERLGEPMKPLRDLYELEHIRALSKGLAAATCLA